MRARRECVVCGEDMTRRWAWAKQPRESGKDIEEICMFCGRFGYSWKDRGRLVGTRSQ